MTDKDEISQAGKQLSLSLSLSFFLIMKDDRKDIGIKFRYTYISKYISKTIMQQANHDMILRNTERSQQQESSIKRNEYRKKLSHHIHS